MILRTAHSSPAESAAQPQPAWPMFESTQNGAPLPCTLVPQPAHAVLAGELARRLLPDAFGELPPDILEAIRLHDIGWVEADGKQIRQLQADVSARPVSFTGIAPAASIVAWRRSIRHAETISPAAAIITSRHFCSLATDGEAHHEAFLEEESARRRQIEESYPSPNSLNRWLGALGFCDLLSLTLCSGHTHPVYIPLAHPNMLEAKTARKVNVRCRNAEFSLSPAVLRTGESLQADAYLCEKAGEHGSQQNLTWTLLDG